MSLPTPVIKLDDGTGTYPTVITNSVRWADGVSLSGFGRSDEFSTAQPSTMTLTLDNASGAFSTGAGAVSPGQGIRWTETSGATTVDRFTGRISSAELAWPTGGQEFSTVVLTCIDPLAEFARHPLRSMIEQEILVDAPTGYYTLAEPGGSTSAGDTSGNQAPSLTIAGTGTALSFGPGLGPSDGLSCVQFSGGTFLRNTLSSTYIAAGSSFTLECFFATNAAPAITSPIVHLSADTGAPAFLAITAAGKLLGITFGGASVTSAASVNDGLVHHAALTIVNGGTVTLYLDGVNVGTAGPATVFTDPLVRFSVAPADLPLTTPYAGSVAHATVYQSVLSAGRVASHAGVLTGFPENTAVRITRLASYVGTTCTTSSGSGQLVAAQDTIGQSALDAMQAVATAEGGVLYVDGSGVLRMQGRNYRGLKTTATLALVAEDPDPETRIPYDTQQLINSASVSHTNGADQLVQDATATSATGPGMFAASLDLIVPDDASALAAAQWLVGKHKTPAPRISSMTVNMLSPVTSAATVLALTVGDRVSLVLPSQTWASAGDYTIEGWAETLSISEWSITFNLVPWSLNQAWILGDATYGVLGSTTILGY